MGGYTSPESNNKGVHGLHGLLRPLRCQTEPDGRLDYEDNHATEFEAVLVMSYFTYRHGKADIR